MQYQYKFEKILSIKEKEKNDAFSKYSEALRQFEEAAEKLYKLLKKKEELHEFQQQRLGNGMSVQDIRHHQLFMENLENIISHNQKAVIDARHKMNVFQEKLMETNMEVRKYEKIKENDLKKFIDHNKYLENIQMDEISIQQYLAGADR
ncbi:flagellar export protein FliJ [Peribacillus deserti]|uniref:Flagellar FliJ protein n=1 Tax=Peribacillus deserti TaxID=673318 RepID=A0A2N5MB29_9BACI|nr:flagellar export protein FliJ [Peribacillus deserti]PLT31547.1 flagellar export protein FliJ [Peribacillus deserti]